MTICQPCALEQHGECPGKGTCLCADDTHEMCGRCKVRRSVIVAMPAQIAYCYECTPEHLMRVVRQDREARAAKKRGNGREPSA